MMELRPGAPDSGQVGLLFVVEPEDTVVSTRGTTMW
jgi:hypothetical protein